DGPSAHLRRHRRRPAPSVRPAAGDRGQHRQQRHARLQGAYGGGARLLDAARQAVGGAPRCPPDRRAHRHHDGAGRDPAGICGADRRGAGYQRNQAGRQQRHPGGPVDADGAGAGGLCDADQPLCQAAQAAQDRPRTERRL
ncbi:MAG: Flagellar basal-body rod protein FlgB, partial [uncultured Sphingomonas sp.]